MALAFIFLVAAMYLISLVSLVAATRSGVVIGPGAIMLGGWLALTGWLAAHGTLSNFQATPPAFLVVFVIAIALTIALARSVFGLALSFLPLWALIGMQSFRIAMELILYQLHREQLAPVQMTFAGANFDVLSGATGLVLGIIALRWKLPKALVLIWNIASLLLLVAIVAIALASTPRFHVFAEPNRFASTFPYAWLPMFLVPLAFLGHLLVFRKLMRGDDPSSPRTTVARPGSPNPSARRYG